MTRLLWWAALVAGSTFMVAVSLGWSDGAVVAWKGAGVGLLALWCAVQARSTDGWLIAAAMAASALGDVLLDAAGLERGAVAFAISHVLAIILYARNRRAQLTMSQRLLAALVVPASVIIVWAMLAGAPGWWHAALYTCFVAAMAAMAWTSRFPRYRTGIGAMMFVASDLLIFARMGDVMAPQLASLLIWPLYFGGQALIARGVVGALAANRP